MSDLGIGDTRGRRRRPTVTRRRGPRLADKPGILVVEPDIVVRHPLAEYLRACGFRVFEATSAAVAREFLAADAVRVDIVLADVNESQSGGFVLAAWIRNNRPTIEVVLAGTMARAAEKAGEICEKGPELAKPYDHKLVLNHIRRLIAARDRNRPTKR